MEDGEDEEADYDFDKFLHGLQEILPEDEAFIYFETGHEKLRYVTGFVVVCTKHEIRSTSLEAWAKEQAKAILGDDFTTKTEY